MQNKLSAQPPALLSFLLHLFLQGHKLFWVESGEERSHQCLGVGPHTKPSGMLLECGQVAFLAFLWGLRLPRCSAS